MRLPSPGLLLPSWQNALLSIISAILLTLAFPNFDLWYLAWFVLVPLIWSIDRERGAIGKSFVVGWLFGTVFFFGTCWWLTFAPINYAAFPPARGKPGEKHMKVGTPQRFPGYPQWWKTEVLTTIRSGCTMDSPQWVGLPGFLVRVKFLTVHTLSVTEP